MDWLVAVINQTNSSKKSLWFDKGYPVLNCPWCIPPDWHSLCRETSEEVRRRTRSPVAELYRLVSLSIDNNIIMTCIAKDRAASATRSIAVGWYGRSQHISFVIRDIPPLIFLHKLLKQLCPNLRPNKTFDTHVQSWAFPLWVSTVYPEISKSPA